MLTQKPTRDPYDELGKDTRKHVDAARKWGGLFDGLKVNGEVECGDKNCREEEEHGQAGSPNFSLANDRERNHGTNTNTMLPVDEDEKKCTATTEEPNDGCRFPRVLDASPLKC